MSEPAGMTERLLDQRRERLDDIRAIFLEFICGSVTADDVVIGAA
jgi:hypothetical protein